MITLEEHAAELYDVIRGCTLCPLWQTRTNAVPGEGPVDAEVLFIGEAPGANEDKQGRPFVGAAGNFLTELIQAAGLTRDQVYICNVLKCRPPGNRDPLPGEIEACNEYLELQIDMVDPLVIVTLGRFSMSRWFPQQAISKIHGSVKEFDGRLVVPMYHPAAALHQGSLRQVLLDDFAGLPAVVERARSARATAAAQSATLPPPKPELAISPQEAEAPPVEEAPVAVPPAAPSPPTQHRDESSTVEPAPPLPPAPPAPDPVPARLTAEKNEPEQKRLFD